MKRTSLLISAALLSLLAGVQTAMAQKVTLYMRGNQTFECDIAQLDSIVFSEAQTIPAEEIVVTIDASGNADGGHLFEKIDETNFYIDDIKYTAQSGDLVVTGYNQAFFKGAANIISQLKYRGRTMNVVKIGDSAFSGCSSLTSITIPKSVTIIGSYVFSYCSSLTSITIPESVISIDAFAFYKCTSLTSVTIPNSVTSIGSYAFAECTSLTSVSIGSGVTSIGSYAFSGCTSLTSVTIPNSVTSIGSYAFKSCTSLTSITIPNSVTSIGSGAFSGCSSLTSSIVECDNTVYDSCNNCNAIIEKATNTLIAGCMNTVIPESVTSIGGYAFSGCTGLTSITIPESVTSIGNAAFADCSSLTDVYCYAENVPSTFMGVYDSFYNSPISSATLHVPAGSVSAYKAASPWSGFGSIVAIE